MGTVYTCKLLCCGTSVLCACPRSSWELRSVTRPSRRVNSWPKPDRCRPKFGGGSLSHCRAVSSSESRSASDAASSSGSSGAGMTSAHLNSFLQGNRTHSL